MAAPRQQNGKRGRSTKLEFAFFFLISNQILLLNFCAGLRGKIKLTLKVYV